MLVKELPRHSKRTNDRFSSSGGELKSRFKCRRVRSSAVRTVEDLAAVSSYLEHHTSITDHLFWQCLDQAEKCQLCEVMQLHAVGRCEVAMIDKGASYSL
jgi:hypothetical protein